MISVSRTIVQRLLPMYQALLPICHLHQLLQSSVRWTLSSALLEVEIKAHRNYAAHVAWIHPYFRHKGVGLEQAQMGLHPTEAMQVDTTVLSKKHINTSSLPSVSLRWVCYNHTYKSFSTTSIIRQGVRYHIRLIECCTGGRKQWLYDFALEPLWDGNF